MRTSTSLEATMDAEATLGAEHPSPTPAIPSERSDRVGRYVLLERIGRGAMGVVYAAYDPDLDRKIALKLLQSSRRGAAQEEEQRARLQREAQAIAKVSHPNVVHVYEVGLYDEQVYLAMEFIEGQTLGDWLQASPRELDEILTVYIDAGRGLAAAHHAGLVHRDFKPDNVLVDGQGRPRVLDFGLARSKEDLGEQPAPATPSNVERSNALLSASSSLTRTGALMGTPAYMSAEQFAGQAATAKSDQFAFCVALWAALCGQRPFGGDSPMAISFQVAQGALRPMPPEAGVPGSVRSALERGLSLDPDQRWPDMDALLAALAPEPIHAQRRFGLALGLGLSVLVALAIYLASTRTAAQPPCANASAPMDTLWNEDMRADIRTALEGASSSAGEWVAERVDTSLDEYAARWRESSTAACEATHLLEQQSERSLALRQDCLDRRLAAFEGLSTELAAADREILERAQEAVRSLPALELCDDVEALQQLVPPPDDPREAEPVAELRRGLAQASSRTSLGRYEESLAQLDALAEQARPLSYLPVQAEIALERAQVQAKVGAGSDLEALALHAYELAIAADHPVAACDAATTLANTIGYRHNRFDAGRQWLASARALLPRLGEHRTLGEARIAQTEGSIALRANELERAREAKLRAQQLFLEAGDAFESSGLLNDLAVIEIMSGKLDTARALLEQVRDERIALLGDRHPSIGYLIQNLASVAERSGDDELALRLFGEAMTIAEQSRGRTHPSYSMPLLFSAHANIRLGQLELAHEQGLQALALLEGSENQNINLARALTMNADIERARGELDAALELATRGLAVAEAAVGLAHPNSALARQALAEVLLARGEFELAEVQLARVLEVGRQHPKDRVGGDAHFGLARVHAERGEFEQARAQAQLALDWFTGAPATGHPRDTVEAWLKANLPVE